MSTDAIGSIGKIHSNRNNIFNADFGSLSKVKEGSRPEETAGSLANKGSDNLFEETAGSLASNNIHDKKIEETAGSLATNGGGHLNLVA